MNDLVSVGERAVSMGGRTLSMEKNAEFIFKGLKMLQRLHSERVQYVNISYFSFITWNKSLIIIRKFSSGGFAHS